MDQQLENIVQAPAFQNLAEAKTIQCSINDIDAPPEQKYDIESCQAMQRISYILSYYKSWIQQKLSINEIYEEAENNDYDTKIHMFDVINSGKYLPSYNNTKLLNDFYHMVECHRYETIQKLLICMDKDDCYIENHLCQLLVRNYRNRNSTNLAMNQLHKHKEQRSDLYFGFTTSTEVATQQILDAIHCFIYHSYDLGHILSASQLSLFKQHRREYKHQLMEDNEQIMSLSQTPNPPIATRATRQSILYNQKINISELENNEDHDSGTESQETEDSLSHTPNSPITPVTPKMKDDFKSNSERHNSFVAPIFSVNNGNLAVKKKYNKSSYDHELKKKIKLSNSKMVIIKQIMKQNDNEYIQKMLCKNQGKSDKYIYRLSSYKHLLQEFDDEPSIDSKSNDVSLSVEKLNIKKGKMKPPKHKKALSVSISSKFKRVRSETGGKFVKSLSKKSKGRKGTKSHRSLQSVGNNILALPELDSDDFGFETQPYSKYIKDTTNAGLTFDYGQRYYYWMYYKDNEDVDTLWNNNMQYKYWYIEARESSLKMEMMHLSQYNPKQSQATKKSKGLLSSKKAHKKLKLKDHHSEDKEVDEYQNETIYCGMSMEEWNDIEERAHHIHRTVKCKTVICDSFMWQKEYGIKQNDILKKENIIAVLIFCTYDRIRNEFLLSFNQFYNTSLVIESEALSKKHKSKKKDLLHYNQRGIEWMKHNHAYFAHLGRLLRETVECFGQRLNEEQERSFYFGINDALGVFKKTCARFKLPLLCSSKMNVVLHYMKFNQVNDGLLVEMKYYQPFIRYFDCWFASTSLAENEVIFNGGISMLKIDSIYHVGACGDNYFYFIRAMNILQSMLTGKMRKEPLSEYDEQIIRYLVQNEFVHAMNNYNNNSGNRNEMIPSYISLLFHHFCINLNAICINLCRMNDKSSSGYFAIKHSFFTSQNNFVKLDVLCSLFPNVPTIKILGDAIRKANCIKLDDTFFEEVLLILQSNLISSRCQLTRIMVTNPNEECLSLESALDVYEAQFESICCKMSIDTKSRELVLYRSRSNKRHHFIHHDAARAPHAQEGCLIQ